MTAPADAGLRKWRPTRGAWYWLTAAACLVLFSGQALICACYNSQTFDEAAYLAAGYSYLARQDFRLMPEHPPLAKELAALPVRAWYNLPFQPDPAYWRQAQFWAIGRDFLYRSPAPHDRILLLARLPSLVIGTLLVALVWCWSYRLWGKGPALLTLGLAAFEPNLIAHSALATTDIGLTFFMVLTCYLLWEYAGARSPWLMAAAAVAAGLALAFKHSALLIVPFFGLALWGPAFAACFRRSPSGQGRVEPGVWLEFARAAILTLMVACFVVLVLEIVYLGCGVSAWSEGLQLQWAHKTRGHPAFFLGSRSHSGWWMYFVVAFLLKTPLASLLLMAACALRPTRGRPFGGRTLSFLWLPAAVWLAGITFARVDLGIRYILPVYPLLFVATGRLATVVCRPAWIPAGLLGLALASVAVSDLRTLPHQLAYFNELAGGPAGGRRWLSDSNLDWGQDLKGLKRFMERQGVATIYLSYFGTAPPGAYGIRYQYLPPPSPFVREGWAPSAAMAGVTRELLAISVTNLQGVYIQNKPPYGWLASRRPVARVGGSIYVYDITGDKIAHLKLASLYVDAGLPHLAQVELTKAHAVNPRTRSARHPLERPQDAAPRSMR